MAYVGCMYVCMYVVCMFILAGMSHMFCAFADIWRSCTGFPQGDAAGSHNVLYCMHAFCRVCVPRLGYVLFHLPTFHGFHICLSHAWRGLLDICLLISCHVVLRQLRENFGACTCACVIFNYRLLYDVATTLYSGLEHFPEHMYVTSLHEFPSRAFCSLGAQGHSGRPICTATSAVACRTAFARERLR